MTTTSRATRWLKPHVPELVDAIPDADHRLDAVYDLLAVEPVDRERLRLALDDLTHPPPQRPHPRRHPRSRHGGMLITARRTTAPPPAGDELEAITLERAQHGSPWPLLAALALATGVGPATAWLLLYAPITATQLLGIAAGIPIGLGLLAAASTLDGRDTHR